MAGFMENQVKEYCWYVLGIRAGNDVLHQWGNKCVAVITNCNSSVCGCWNSSPHYCGNELFVFFFWKINLSVYEMCSTVIKWEKCLWVVGGFKCTSVGNLRNSLNAIVINLEHYPKTWILHLSRFHKPHVSLLYA